MDDPRDLELFLTDRQIQHRVQQLGAEISRDFAAQPLVLVGVLKGATIFLSDLARAIANECTFDFISVSSYGGGLYSSGSVRIAKDLEESIAGRHVLLVEDIVDTGVTLGYLRDLLLARNPATLKSVALLDKPARRVRTIHADYVGFAVPDRFAVGYGMDYAERYRNLPQIYFMPSVIQLE